MTGEIELRVDGRSLRAAPGTSVAAALVNGGVRGFRESARGEPRGPLCGMGSCHECRVTIDGVPHRRSCAIPVAAGMEVATAGAKGGFAPASGAARTLDAEVVVVGAGPAGIAAATRAAEAGRRVLLLDEGARPGGQVWRHREADGLPPAAAVALDRLAASGADALHGTSVVGAPRPGLLVAERDDEALRVRWSEGLVLAVGARERFLPFPGWTLPGVVGAGGAQALLESGLEARGLRVVVAGSGPLLLPVAARLRRAGARVALVAEQASRASVLRFAGGLWRTPGKLLEAARLRAAFRGAPYRPGWWVHSAAGGEGLEEVTLTNGEDVRAFGCDLLCVGYGLVPALELPRALGCRAGPGGVEVDARQATSVPGVYCAGESTGVAGAEAAAVEGAIAGLAAAGRGEEARGLFARRDRARGFARRLEERFRPRPELRERVTPTTPVCRCEDVTAAALTGCASAREAKLRTRAGMGPCQGRVCGPALSFLHGWGADTVRPPISPARLDTLAGAVRSENATHAWRTDE